MTYREGRLAVLALEAGPVEDDAVSGELVHRVHRLGAHLALLLRPAEHPVSARDLPFLHARSERARSDLGLCARRMSTSAGDGDGRAYIRRRRDAITVSCGIMTGSSPQLAAPHFCRRSICDYNSVKAWLLGNGRLNIGFSKIG
jgi:hypothetical protein